MINSLNGIISAISSDSLTLDVQGVGFEVFVDKNLLNQHQIGDPLRLLIHMVIRQDLLALYGFSSQDEKALFNLLISVDGVGPKLALAILSNLSLDISAMLFWRKNRNIWFAFPALARKLLKKSSFISRTNSRVMVIIRQADLPTKTTKSSNRWLRSDSALLKHRQLFKAFQKTSLMTLKIAFAMLCNFSPVDDSLKQAYQW